MNLYTVLKVAVPSSTLTLVVNLHYDVRGSVSRGIHECVGSLCRCVSMIACVHWDFIEEDCGLIPALASLNET